ncbi:hypothetical protein D3C81_2031130 [compost metagenome]
MLQREAVHQGAVIPASNDAEAVFEQRLLRMTRRAMGKRQNHQVAVPVLQGLIHQAARLGTP